MRPHHLAHSRKGIVSLPIAVFFIALVAAGAVAVGTVASGQSALSAKQLSSEGVLSAKNTELAGLSVASSGIGSLSLTQTSGVPTSVGYVLVQRPDGGLASEPADYAIAPGQTLNVNLMSLIQSALGQTPPNPVTVTLVTALGNYISSQIQTQAPPPPPQQNSPTRPIHDRTTVSTHHTTSGCAAGFTMDAAGHCGAQGGCPGQNQPTCGHPISTPPPPHTIPPPPPPHPHCQLANGCRTPPPPHVTPPRPPPIRNPVTHTTRISVTHTTTTRVTHTTTRTVTRSPPVHRVFNRRRLF